MALKMVDNINHRTENLLTLLVNLTPVVPPFMWCPRQLPSLP